MADEQSAEDQKKDRVERFREHVVGPLERFGYRKPHAFTVDQWQAALDQIGDDLGGRSGVELNKLRVCLMDKGVGRNRTTWPSVISIRSFASEIFKGHVEETGGNTSTDKMVVDAFLKFWRDRGIVAPPTIYKLSRPCRVFAILKDPNAPTVKQLRDAGHDISKDMEQHESTTA